MARRGSSGGISKAIFEYMSFLTIIDQVIAYDDQAINSNPRQKVVDWQRQLLNANVSNPEAQKIRVLPNQELVVFDGSRATSIDNTTAFNLTLSPLDSNVYRITWSGVGTAPAFRTSRSYTGTSFTLTLNSNQTLSVSGPSFSGVIVGDIVFIPGLATGDSAGPFSADNEGFWTVIGSGASLVLARTSPAFSGASEGPITISDPSQFQVFSTDGVQVGDTVALSSGFAAPALKSYTVLTVTPKWFEVFSSSPMANDSGVVPTTSGISFYTNGKVYVRLEYDQECVIRVNGDTGNTNTVQPFMAGDPNGVGIYVRCGNTWKVTVLNKTVTKLNAFVVTAEQATE